jgi:hypothetical protein
MTSVSRYLGFSNIFILQRFCFQGEFEWMFRSRIRIMLRGENLCATPFELHEHVIHPAYRLVFMKLEVCEVNLMLAFNMIESISRTVLS